MNPLSLFVNFAFVSLTIVFINLVGIKCASIVEVTELCFKTEEKRLSIPKCQIEIDLISRQRCVTDAGFFLDIDVEAKEANIVCHGANPLQVKLVLGSGHFLSYDDGKRHTVHYEREIDNGNGSSMHAIKIPVITTHSKKYDLDPVRKYIISEHGPGGTNTGFGEVTLIILFDGSSAIFSIGDKKARLNSDIAYIPCLYDYSHGIHRHDLSTTITETGETYKFNVNPSSYDALKGFRFNVSETPHLYSDSNIFCYGESPSANPFVGGAAVGDPGFGVQYYTGLLVEPMAPALECYDTVCETSCEFDEPVAMSVVRGGHTADIKGHLLFRSYENKTRYLVRHVPRFSVKGEKIIIKCLRVREKLVLHTWTFLFTDILKPVPGQTIRFEELPQNGTLRCISDTQSTEVNRFLSLACANSVECQFYMKCVNNEEAVRKWNDGYITPHTCSPSVAVSKPCDSGNGKCKEIELQSNGIIYCSTTSNIVFEAEYITGYDDFISRTNPLVSSKAIVRIASDHNGNFHSNGFFQFTCESHRFLTEHGLQWKLKWTNGSISAAVVSEQSSDKSRGKSENPFRRSRLLIESSNIISVICSAPLIHSNDWIDHAIPIDVKESILPNVIVEKSVYVVAGSSHEIECTTDKGYPFPYVSWLIPTEIQNLKNVAQDEIPKAYTNGQKATLTFPIFNETFAGEYICLSSNGVHNVTRKVTVAIKVKNWTSYIIGGALVLFGLFSVSIFVIFRRWKMTQAELHKISEAELEEFLNGISGNAQEDYGFMTPALALPYNVEYEIDIKNLQIEKEKCLGSGQFGVVYKAKLLADYINVSKTAAVKTLKANCSKDDLRNILNEIKIMIYLGKHSNLVQLTGAYTKDCRKGEVYMVMEFCEMGSLKAYLESNRERLELSLQEDTDFEPSREPSSYNAITTMNTLVQWSYDIVCGMDYISSKRMIHGDLAIRNVLLQNMNGRNVAKVGDFGLSRKLYEYTQYVKTNQEPLPWRWLAIEVLRQMKFSEMSDAWAFGITLWEIFSLGDIPYPGFSYSMEFLNMLENGMRNSRPKYACNQIKVIFDDMTSITLFLFSPRYILLATDLWGDVGKKAVMPDQVSPKLNPFLKQTFYKNIPFQ